MSAFDQIMLPVCITMFTICLIDYHDAGDSHRWRLFYVFFAGVFASIAIKILT